MSVKQQILICDDQHIIHETLGVYLRNEGSRSILALTANRRLKNSPQKTEPLLFLIS